MRDDASDIDSDIDSNDYYQTRGDDICNINDNNTCYRCSYVIDDLHQFYNDMDCYENDMFTKEQFITFTKSLLNILKDLCMIQRLDGIQAYYQFINQHFVTICNLGISHKAIYKTIEQSKKMLDEMMVLRNDYSQQIYQDKFDNLERVLQNYMCVWREYDGKQVMSQPVIAKM